MITHLAEDEVAMREAVLLSRLGSFRLEFTLDDEDGYYEFSACITRSGEHGETTSSHSLDTMYESGNLTDEEIINVFHAIVYIMIHGLIIDTNVINVVLWRLK